MYSIPINEAERVAAIETYHLIDTPPEVVYDDIAAVVRKKLIALTLRRARSRDGVHRVLVGR